MQIIADAIRLLSESPGSLIYHLVVLFALEFAVALVWSQRSQEKQQPMSPWFMAAVALAAGRLLLMGLALLSRLGAVHASPVAAPLERAVDAASAGFIVWACLSASGRSRVLDIVLAVNTLAAIVIGIVFAIQWASTASSTSFIGYNDSPQAGIWEIGQVVILGLGLIGTPRRFIDWPLAESLLGILLVSHLAHFLPSPPTALGVDAAGPVRLAMLLAAPLWVALVYRQMVLALPQLAGSSLLNPPVVSWQVLGSLGPVRNVVEAFSRGMKGSALALTADITAIVVRDDQGESFRLAGVYDRAADRELIGVPIPASDQPFLGEVWETQQLTLLTPEKDASHLQSLYLAMGVEELGPLLIQPIVYGGGTLGLLLAGNPYSLHSFTTTEREIATALGQQLAASVVGAREYEQVVVQWTQANERLREVESTAAERQVALEGEVQEARQIAQRLLAQLRALESTRNRSREPSRLGTEPVASAPATAGAEDLAVAWKEMAERGAILASITQELRSPLTAITGYTDLLLGETVGILGALQRKFLQRIRTNLERMAILLDDAVRLTVGPGAGYQPGAQTVQVRNVVEEVLSRQSIQFREKSLTLDLDVAENLPEIQADRDALAQIVNYLISNACQASPTGGRIRVALFYLAGGGASDPDKQQTDYIQLSVTDSGAGIAPEDQARVFGRLYRTDHPHIPGLGDTGIGLSIAKVLVDAHGGQISIDSHPGSGATFQVLLPLQSTFGQTMAQTLQEQKQPAPVDEFKNGSRT